MTTSTRRFVSIAGLLLGCASGAHAQSPAAKPTPTPTPVAPAVPPELCKGRTVLVFEDEQISQLAMDGLIADIELRTASKSDPEVAKKLVAGLKASGCNVTHWEEPLVSVSVVDGKRTAFFGGDKKQENYKPTHKLTGKELEAHDVVVWVKRASVEKKKTRQGEGLRIDYKFEAQVQARGQKAVDLNGNWQYVQDDVPQGYAGISNYADEEAARKKGVAKHAPTSQEKGTAFDTSVHQAVR